METKHEDMNILMIWSIIFDLEKACISVIDISKCKEFSDSNSHHHFCFVKIKIDPTHLLSYKYPVNLRFSKCKFYSLDPSRKRHGHLSTVPNHEHGNTYMLVLKIN